MTALGQLYEEVNHKALSVSLVVGTHLLNPLPREISYAFAIGQAATMTFTLNFPPPLYLVRNQRVALWVGFNSLVAQVFEGSVEALAPGDGGVTVQCTGEGGKLDYPYKRAVTSTNGVLTSNQLVTNILTAAGVSSFVANLPAWTPGTVQAADLNFQTYAEAVQAIALPKGSPWYEMPTGQIRVELRDPLPAPAPFRQYWKGNLGAGFAQTQPGDVINPDALPRLRALELADQPRLIHNNITVTGAQIIETGPEGEKNYVLLQETADAPSPWLPQINGVDQFIDNVYNSPLLDVLADVAVMADRYLQLENRLVESGTATIDGDPEAFLGMTVGLMDDDANVNGLYFVRGYSGHISDTDYSLDLDVVGGRSAGFTGRLSPFADFTWSNRYSAIPFTIDHDIRDHTHAGAKVLQYVPSGTGDDDHGEGTDGRMVLITFDGSPARDFDGQIVSYAWSDDAGHSGTGKRFTVAFDPDDAGSILMTLVVTDNDGKTSSLTKYVNIKTFGPDNGWENGDDNGGVFMVPNIFIAGATNRSCSEDGGETRNDLAGGANGCTQVAYANGLMGVFWGDGTQLDGVSGRGVSVTIDGCLSEEWNNGGSLGASFEASSIRDMYCEPDGKFWALTGAALYVSEDWGRAGSWSVYGYIAPSGSHTELFESQMGRLLYPYMGGDYLWVDNLDHTFSRLVQIRLPNSRNFVVTEDVAPLAGPTGGLVVRGLGPFYSCTAAGACYAREDVGSSWVQLNASIPAAIAGNVHDLWAEEGLDGVFLFATDAGLVKSFDGGKTAALVFTSWPGGNIAWRISVAFVPQSAPDGPLYNIVVP